MVDQLDKNRNRLLIIVTMLIMLPAVASSQEADSIPFGIMCLRIEEAEEIRDAIVDTLSECTDLITDVFFIHKTSTDTTIIRMDHGADDVFMLGIVVPIPNPGLEKAGRDAQFAAGSFIFDNREVQGVVMSEYIKGSLEERQKMYYFIHMIFPSMKLELKMFGYDTNPFTQDDPVKSC